MKSKARALRCTAGAVNIVAGIAIIVYRSYPGECEGDVLDAQIIVSVGALGRSLPHCASGCSDLDNEEEFSSRVPLDVYNIYTLYKRGPVRICPFTSSSRFGLTISNAVGIKTSVRLVCIVVATMSPINCRV